MKRIKLTEEQCNAWCDKLHKTKANNVSFSGLDEETYDNNVADLACLADAAQEGLDGIPNYFEGFEDGFDTGYQEGYLQACRQLQEN